MQQAPARCGCPQSCWTGCPAGQHNIGLDVLEAFTSCTLTKPASISASNIRRTILRWSLKKADTMQASPSLVQSVPLVAASTEKYDANHACEPCSMLHVKQVLLQVAMFGKKPMQQYPCTVQISAIDCFGFTACAAQDSCRTVHCFESTCWPPVTGSPPVCLPPGVCLRHSAR